MIHQARILLLVFLSLCVAGATLVGQTTSADDLAGPEATSPLSWGGWLGASYADNDLADSRKRFELNHAYLFLDWRLSPAWRLFGEGSFEREVDEFGNVESETNLERLFVNYKVHRGLQFRLGRFNTRSGIVKPLHWDITLDTVQPPVMEANDYVPAKSNGLEIWGTRLGSKGTWHYSFALSHSDDDIDRREPITEARSVGIDLYYQRMGRYRAGGSIFYYADPGDKRRNVTVYVPYFEWWLVSSKLLWRTEAMLLQPSSRDSLDSLYTKFKWQINDKVYLNYRFDNGHDLRLDDDRRHTVNTLTAAYWPVNQWRIKVELARHNIERDLLPEFTQWSVWTGYVF